MLRGTTSLACALLLALALGAALEARGEGAAAPETSAGDASAAGPPFEEGDVISYAEVEKLRPYLPEEFWAHREFFFYEGMQLEIGPAFRDYSPAVPYAEATERFAGQARIGPEGSLESYTAGEPFPGEIDCAGDPDAGVKIMWNFDYQWEGDGSDAHYFYSYWDRGERMSLYYEGTSKQIQLSHRVEPRYLEEQGGDLFERERRKYAFGIEVESPPASRGIKVMTYRYQSADGPPSEAKNDDTWVYQPAMRRVRRISTKQRTDAVAGTDFTLDDLRSFSGIVPQYEWTCLERGRILAPTNTRVAGYPYDEDHSFGPYGLSYADDVWELRRAVKVRMEPKNEDHPYHHKDLWLDAQTWVPLYSFAYDRKEELWKIIWHNNRWSGASRQWDEDYYPGWKGVPQPRDLKVVSDTIVNVQTGTGNRIEFWDNHGHPLDSDADVRRYIDINRLTRGR